MRHQKPIIFFMLFFVLSNAWSQTLGIKIIAPDSPAITNAKKRIQSLAHQLSQQKIKSSNEIAYRMESAITTALQPYGYFSPSITLSPSAKKQKPQLNFIVQLGPPTRINQVQIKLSGPGKNLPKLTSLVAQFPLKKNMQLNTENYKNAKITLSQAASQSGYINHDFTVEELLINTDTHQASIQLEFDTGALYTFGHTQFSQVSLSPTLLQRYRSYQEGDAFNNQKLSDLQEMLGKSGYFNSVVVSPQLPKSSNEPTQKNQIITEKSSPIDLAFSIASLLQKSFDGFAIDLKNKKILTMGIIPSDNPIRVFPIDQNDHFDSAIIQVILQQLDDIQKQYPQYHLILYSKNETASSLASLKLFPWFKDQTAARTYQQTHPSSKWLNLNKASSIDLPSLSPTLSTGEYSTQTPQIPIHVFLDPKAKRSHKVSFGYGTNNGLRASFQSEYPFVNRSGHSLATAVTVAKRLAISEMSRRHVQVDTDYPTEATIQAKYSIPGFKPSQETFVLDSALNRSSFYSPEGRKPAKNIMLTARYVNSKKNWDHSTNMTYLHETSKITANESFDILSPSALWTYQKTNHIVHPTQGFLASVQLRGATNINDNKHNFFSIKTNWRHLMPITRHTRVMLRLNAGYLSLLNQTFVPKTYQLLAGGSTSMRGFDYMGVGPGKLMAITNIDAQYEITPSWYIGSFLDAGNIYSEWKAVQSPKNTNDYTKKSYGLTLTKQTPIGALTASYARAKKYTDRWKWQPKWHISIGSEI